VAYFADPRVESNMSLGRSGVWIGAGAAVLFVAALSWPAPFDHVLPGWGQRALEIRHGLPAGLAGALPTYAPGVQHASAAGPRGGQTNIPRPVLVAKVHSGPLPVRIDAVGTVQPIATVALKTRVDATIDKILVADGAEVKAGEVLVKLDDRQIQAQIQAAEAALDKDKATLEQNMRDMQRFQDLVQRGAGTQLNYDNARTQVTATRAQIAGDQAQIDNLKVQLGWYTITAPIPGRVGTFSAKQGSIVRAGDNTATGILATIAQFSPIYVTFGVPQAELEDLRKAYASKAGAEVQATPQGAREAARGKVAVLDNTVDPTTGTISVRAIFDNADEALWPGELCNVRVTVRTDPDAITIPRSATQSSQIGNFVYVVENGIAHVRPIKIARTQDDVDVVAEGLKGGETIVTDGALLLVDGAKVEVRTADSGNPGAGKGAI
jgi:membrane fusion protein, multidrug efflux system